MIVAAILPKDIEKALKDRDPPPIVEELKYTSAIFRIESR